MKTTQAASVIHALTKLTRIVVVAPACVIL